ncbi:MAG: hypothetical protein ACRDJC_03950 [Thermomicrobiales bacterium]
MGTFDIRRTLEGKLASGYRASDVGQAARDLSALWETTLVSSGHNWSSTYLYNQTEDLAALGWTGAPDLHLLRRTNNDAKHGTPISATAGDILAALQRLERSCSSLEPLIPGLQQDIDEPRLRRIVCAIYDYFAQGETEFAFLEATPSDTWMTCRTFEEFQVSSSEETKIRAELEELDGWKYDPPEFDDFKASLRESDNELWRIAVFTAQYEDAHSIVSRFQHDRDLIGGLHRDDHVSNVLATLCLVQSRKSANGGLFNVEELLRGAVDAGLVPRRRDLHELAEAVIEVFSRLNPGQRSGLIVDRANPQVFEHERSRTPAAVDQDHGMLVTREGVLFVRTL